MSGEKKANKGLLRKCAKFAYMLSHKSKKNTLQNAHYVANFGTILSSFSGGQTAVSRIVISLCSGTPLVWSFFRSEWPRLVERFSLNDRYLGRLPKYITDTFNTRCAEHSLALCEQAHSFFFFFFLISVQVPAGGDADFLCKVSGGGSRSDHGFFFVIREIESMNKTSQLQL